MLITISITAQQGINYKALIKDGGGNVIANQGITLQFQILQGDSLINVYQETHTPTTDTNGIVIVNISEGVVDSGVFADIDWGSDTHALKTEIDTGSGLVDMGTTEFNAVPYALHATNAAGKIDELSDGKSDASGSSIFLGINSGLNDVGSTGNVGMGFEVLKNNTTGSFNTANGYQALLNNITGNFNSALGSITLSKNTIGSFNTANGASALRLNTDGSDNTAIGADALASNELGNFNVGLGSFALFKNYSGNDNTGCGTGVLFNDIIGNGNSGFGSFALSDITTGSYNIGIGYNAQVPDGTADNQVRIGDTLITSASIQVAWTYPSDKRWKEQIRELPYGLELLKQLKPVDYVRKNNAHKTREMGFIAQDVEALLDNIGYSDQGFLHKDDRGLMSLRYNDFIALLTKAIQEQQEIIEEQKSEIKSQQNEINSINLKMVKTQESQKAILARLLQLESAFNTLQQ